jgi:hypothetical protein
MLEVPYCPKPKWMRWRTHKHLMEEIGVRPPVPLQQTGPGLPAPQRVDVDAANSAGRSVPRSICAGLFDVAHQVLAVFQAGHASSPWWKTAASFFDSTSKAAVSASALSVLAMQLALQLLDPPAVLSGLRGAGRPRFAETGDRILFPGVQLCRIQPLLAAPGAPGGLIHRRSDDHRLQSCRPRPARTAATRRIGQGTCPPALQRRYAYPCLT